MDPNETWRLPGWEGRRSCSQPIGSTVKTTQPCSSVWMKGRRESADLNVKLGVGITLKGEVLLKARVLGLEAGSRDVTSVLLVILE